MKLPSLFSPLLVCLLPTLLALAPIHAADFEMNGHGTLSVSVPEGWESKGEPTTRPQQGEIGYTVTITAPEELNARALITCLYVQKEAPTHESVREFMKKNTARFVEGSVEKKITPQDFTLKQGFGSYSIFTDPKLVGQPIKKNDSKVMASGIVQPNEDLLIVITLLCDDADGKLFKTLVQTINSIVAHKPAKGPAI